MPLNVGCQICDDLWYYVMQSLTVEKVLETIVRMEVLENELAWSHFELLFFFLILMFTVLHRGNSTAQPNLHCCRCQTISDVQNSQFFVNCK